MYSRCWLPNLKDKDWFKKILKTNIFGKIYIPDDNNFLKKEIIFFTNKKISKFIKNEKNATLIFKYKLTFKNEEYSINYRNNKLYINSKNKNGFVYGLFNLFKLIQLNLIKKNKNFYIQEKPNVKIRMINHLDHINGNIDKNYAGNSIFFFNNKIHFNLLRIKYYARLLASIGINYLCINSYKVNLYDTYLITKPWLIQLYEIYNIYIKYNIKIFLSINYKSPFILGKLENFNLTDNKIIQWWIKKIEEIYEYMPFLGGLIINFKKNIEIKKIIEYSRLIGNFLKNFNGFLIIKCFSYEQQNWRFRNIDRACLTYKKFYYLDGLLLDNVILQINNGPIGGQIREPVNSLFGSMKYTAQILELQITQEYTGQKDICWLLPQWKYILNFNTFCLGNKNKSKIKKIFSGKIYNIKNYGISGISNIGDNSNWTANELAQANLFGFGRLLWNLEINLNNLLKEWIQLSFNSNKLLINNISKIMFNSWKIYEKYTSPLGIGGMVASDKYKPNIDHEEYSNKGIYHNSDRYGLGTNRKKYIKQYFHKNRLIFSNKNKCPEELILFFHKLPYNFYLKHNKKSIIQYIYDTHFQSVNHIIKWILLWKKIKEFICPKIFKNIKNILRKQYLNACEWRDQINTYFFRKSGIKDKFNRKIYF